VTNTSPHKVGGGNVPRQNIFLKRGALAMRVRQSLIGAIIFAAGLAAGAALSPGIGARADGVIIHPAPQVCPAGVMRVRTTLYFGRARPGGMVSDAEWQMFLRDEVTRRFPDGLTAWDAAGQWRTPSGAIEEEPSKVLALIHPDTMPARDAVQAVIDAYRKMFQQQAVLWETVNVCVAV
jgi:hypothetical protein